MHLTRRAALLTFTLLLGTAQAAPKSDELITKLLTGPDFRVRVQAALELGRGASEPDAVQALIRALDDKNASVRAASAAALKSLGASAALGALRAHENDPSNAVRSQIKTSIASLERAERNSSKTQVLVKLGHMRNGTSVKSKNVQAQLVADSRKKLAQLPGVEVLVEGADSARESKRRRAPVVLVEGQIQKLKAARSGREIVYSAAVEYIIHTMPDQSIAAKVTGSASAALSQEEARDSTRSAELRRSVLEAAIESALRRAPRALLAAARL